MANDTPAPAPPMDLDDLRRKVAEHERRIADLDTEMQELRKAIAMRKVREYPL